MCVDVILSPLGRVTIIPAVTVVKLIQCFVSHKKRLVHPESAMTRRGEYVGMMLLQQKLSIR